MKYYLVVKKVKFALSKPYIRIESTSDDKSKADSITEKYNQIADAEGEKDTHYECVAINL
jgi:hypothetical protein